MLCNTYIHTRSWARASWTYNDGWSSKWSHDGLRVPTYLFLHVCVEEGKREGKGRGRGGEEGGEKREGEGEGGGEGGKGEGEEGGEGDEGVKKEGEREGNRPLDCYCHFPFQVFYFRT